MFKSFLTRLPKINTKQGLLQDSAKKAFSIATVGANGRRLPFPEEKSFSEHDPEMAELLLKE